MWQQLTVTESLTKVKTFSKKSIEVVFLVPVGNRICFCSVEEERKVTGTGKYRKILLFNPGHNSQKSIDIIPLKFVNVTYFEYK